MKEQRNSTFDIAKAFGIFFLVSSHVRWWHITYVFTNFYMALFFFISGYFIKIEDMSLLSYIKSKIRSLYIPFVMFSLVFLIFHNFLYQIGITNGQYGIYDYIKKIRNIISMNNTEILLIPIWFITVLFIISIIYGLIYKAFYNMKYKDNTILVVAVLMYCVNAFVIKVNYSYSCCNIVSGILSSFVFLAAGHFIRRKNFSIQVSEKTFVWGIVLIIILELVLYWSKFAIDVRQNICTDWFIYLPIAFIGIYLTIFISKIIFTLLPKTSKVLAYMGQNTLIILFLHPVLFKFIGLFQVHVLNSTYEGDLRNWGNVNTQGLWAFLYCTVGCIVPLIIQYVYQIVCKYVRRILGVRLSVRGRE